MNYQGATCRSCGEPIIWTKTEATGSAMPVDRNMVLGGNTELRKDGMRTLSRVVRADPALMMYVSHFVTCPNREKHRKKPAPGKAARERKAIEAAADKIIEARQDMLRELADQ